MGDLEKTPLHTQGQEVLPIKLCGFKARETVSNLLTNRHTHLVSTQEAELSKNQLDGI